MKLQTKLILSIMAGIVVVSLASQAFQQFSSLSLADRRAAQSAERVEAMQWAYVGNLQQIGQAALIEDMSAGEMEKFGTLLEAQGRVKGVQELSLFDEGGKVTQSSNRAFVGRPLPDDLRAALLSRLEPQRRRTDESFEIYSPVAVTDSCLRCHADFKGRAVAGVMAFRFSTDGLKETRAEWTDFATELRNENLRTGGLTTLFLILIVGAVVMWQAHSQVARPLGLITRTLHEGATVVSLAAGSIAAASQDLASGANAQAAASEETSASLEETSSMARRNAERAAEAERLAEGAREAAEAGVQAVRDLKTAMVTMEQSTGQVSSVLKTIDEIAFQTNLLALNAAVEAARAGERGMGFAVVAEEVRNLARRSADAAKSTAAMAENAIAQSRMGTELTGRVGAQLENILEKTKLEDACVKEIARASQEQLQGIDQIQGAVTQIDQITQSNAASAEESAAAAADLHSHAGTLESNINELIRLVHGSDGAVATSAPSAVPVPAHPPAPAPAAGRSFHLVPAMARGGRR